MQICYLIQILYSFYVLNYSAINIQRIVYLQSESSSQYDDFMLFLFKYLKTVSKPKIRVREQPLDGLQYGICIPKISVFASVASQPHTSLGNFPSCVQRQGQVRSESILRAHWPRYLAGCPLGATSRCAVGEEFHHPDSR